MEIVGALTLVVIFLPLGFALFGYGGIWKFLTLLCCGLTLLSVATIIGAPFAVLWWILAWVFAALARRDRLSYTSR